MALLKKIISVKVVLLLLLSQQGLTPSAHAVLVNITAPSAVLLDSANHRFVYSKTPHIRRQPASTTKVLTAIVAYETLPLNKVITIPGFVTRVEPSKAYLRPGDRWLVRDLIRATLIKSANDAAEVLAVAVSGSMPRFAAKMNAKARSIGCRNSHFVRSSGLPASNQYSTSYDLALIMNYAQRHAFLVDTLKIRTIQISSLSGRRVFLKNHNKMLWRDRREVLGKTGWTRAARHCFVGRIRVANRKVFVALMGSHSLWRDLTKLVDYQFGTSYWRPRQAGKSAAIKPRRIDLQRALKKAGYNPGRVNGVWQKQTVAALKKFQKAKGLPADGVAGPKTWQKLKSYL